MSTNERTGKAGGLPLTLLKALCIGLVVMVVLTALTALGISKELLPEAAFSVAPYVISALSVIVCALFASRRHGAKPVPIGALSGLIFTLTLYIFGLLLPKVSFSPPVFFSLLALNLVCGALGGLPAANTRRRKY